MLCLCVCLCLENSESAGITCFPKWFAFKPVKSNISDSLKEIEKIGASFSAASGEAAMYFVNRAIVLGEDGDDCKKVELCVSFVFNSQPFF